MKELLNALVTLLTRIGAFLLARDNGVKAEKIKQLKRSAYEAKTAKKIQDAVKRMSYADVKRLLAEKYTRK